MSMEDDNFIRFQILGTPTILNDGEPTRLYSAKVWALIGYLSFHIGQPQSREWLATLLWGESSDKKARASLRQALYSIKKSVGAISDDLLKIERDSVTFCSVDNVQIDVVELLYAYETEHYEEIIDLHQGLLLDGVRLSECKEYDAWLYFQRNDIERKVVTALQKTVTQLINRGSIDTALNYAEQLTRLDSLNEEGHRLLMRCHAMDGNLSAARRQYQACVELFERELGVEPTTETTALYEQLDILTQTPITPFAVNVQLEAMSDFPLVQREHDLRILANSWHEIKQQSQNLVIIRGESGAGKSRLIQEMVQQLQIDRVMIGHCFEMEINTPYGMWSDALKCLLQPAWRTQISDLEDIWLQQVARIVPAIGAHHIPEMQGTTPEEKRLRQLQGIVRCLSGLASSPLLLIFEDIHWADESSIELLHYAIRQLAHLPVLFLVALRQENTSPLITQLIRNVSTRSHILDIAPLQVDSIEHLIHATNLPVSSEFSQELFAFSGGNPYVLTETLRTFADRMKHGNDVTIDSIIQVSEGVHQLVLERLINIGEEHQRIMETMAVISRPINVNLLQKISGVDELRLIEYLDVLLSTGFVHETTDRSFIDVSHDYIRQVMLNHLRPLRKSALHRRIAEALIQLPRSRPDEVALHFVQADDERAIQYLMNAAEQARLLYALYEATHLYQQALTFIQQYNPSDYRQQFDMCLQLEQIYDQLGQRGPQAEILSELDRLTRELDDHSLTVLVHVRLAAFLTYTAQYEDAQQSLQTALDYYHTVGDIAREANTLREMGFLQWTNGQYSLALEYNRMGLQLHRREGNMRGEATALHNLAEIHRGLGSPRQAITFYQQAEELHWSVENKDSLILTAHGLGQAYYALNEYAQAKYAYLKALAHSENNNNQMMQSRIYHSLATLHWDQNDTDSALSYIEKAVDISRGIIGYSFGIAHSLWLMSLYHLRSGNIEQSRHSMTEVIEWLDFAEETTLLSEAKQWLIALDSEDDSELHLPLNLNWVRTHIDLTDGKVYCEFESPAALARLSSQH